MKQRLINHINSIQDPALRKTCETILTIDKFFTWPASLSFHHAYEGGLLAHTAEVCDLALGIAGLNISGKLDGSPWEQVMFPTTDRDILIAAALWHDVMKTEEYQLKTFNILDNTFEREVKKTRMLYVPEVQPLEPVTAWLKDETRVRMFGHHEHIISGASFFQKSAWFNNVRVEVIDAVCHCILAHHGRKDWGSPVEPQTLEALILHQADLLSARYGATKDQAL